MHSLNSSLLWKNGLWWETGESEVLIMRTHSTHNTPTSSTTTTVSFSASHQAWTNTHTQTVWAYLNKMPRKLGNSEISSGNPGLIKMDVFFFFFPPWLLWYHARPRSSAIGGGGGYVGVRLILEVGGEVDRRRRALQTFLLLGKTASPWPQLWKQFYSTQWAAILGRRWFITAPCLLNLWFKLGEYY